LPVSSSESEIAKHPRPPAAALRGAAATRHHVGDYRRTSDAVDYGERAHTGFLSAINAAASLFSQKCT